MMMMMMMIPWLFSFFLVGANTQLCQSWKPPMQLPQSVHKSKCMEAYTPSHQIDAGTKTVQEEVTVVTSDRTLRSI